MIFSYERRLPVNVFTIFLPSDLSNLADVFWFEGWEREEESEAKSGGGGAFDMEAERGSFEEGRRGAFFAPRKRQE